MRGLLEETNGRPISRANNERIERIVHNIFQVPEFASPSAVEELSSSVRRVNLAAGSRQAKYRDL